MLGSLIVLLLLFSGWYLFQANIPPYYSNSFSLNTKLLHIQKQSFNKFDVITMGSSMTLSNLNSEVIVNKFGNNYYNFSSWGQDISMTRYFGEIYAKLYEPRLVIICSYYGDFVETSINYSSFSPTLFSSKINVLNWFHAGCTNFRRAKRDFKNNQHFFSHREQYESLVFDPYGGVPLNVPKSKIDSIRWNQELICTTSKSQYEELEKLSKYLFDRNIKLVLVQVPIRKGIIDEQKKKQMEQHRIKCEKILNAHTNIYLDYALEETLSNEELFLDRTHLNEIGAKLFTQKLIDDIDSLETFKKLIN